MIERTDGKIESDKSEVLSINKMTIVNFKYGKRVLVVDF